MIKLTDIKCIIWDLDDTLWKGTLSEGEIILNKNFINFIKETTELGIVHSINSKNDYEITKNKLTELGIWDYFVFPSINWEPKGQRIEKQIKNMKLRAENILFVDDNHLNLSEAEYYNEKIKTCFPDEVDKLINQIPEYKEKKNTHNRLKEYKMLEEKFNEQSSFSSNEEFLYSSSIQVEIRDNCEDEFERIHELILRTNQLNYTKKRIDKEELSALLSDKDAENRYIHVHDKFGDYGIVGFYSLKNNKLEHFLFSCRTLGMGIEQYVYSKTGFPQIEISGEVIAELDKKSVPLWINNSADAGNASSDLRSEIKVLFKGPCDIQNVFSYIKGNESFDTELSFVNDNGVYVENHNHTTSIVNSLTITEDEKESFSGLPFYDENIFKTNMFSKKYDVIVLSTLTDQNLGLYRNKENGIIIPFGEYVYPLTQPENHQLYVNGEVSTLSCKFTYEFLKEFSEKYEFLGRIGTEDFIKNLSHIHSNIPSSTKLILILGSETPYEKETKKSCEDRHIRHKEINAAIKKWAHSRENVFFIDINNYIEGQQDFFNNINHYMKHIYFKMATGFTDIVKAEFNTVYKQNKLKYLYENLKLLIKKVINRR